MPKTTLPEPSGAYDDDVIDALVQAAFVTMAVLNRIGAENELSLTQLRVLGILRDRRPRMAALADHLGLEKSTMTGLIARAEQRGLVARAPSVEDGRAVDVFLTRAGTRLVERLYRQVQDALAPLTDRLNAAEQQRLRTLLRRMLAPGDEH